MGALSVLSGCWAVPVAKPAARGGLALDGLVPSVPLLIDLLPGEVRAERLTADLMRSGRPPRWLRLSPYDLDRLTLDALAAAVLDGAGESARGDGKWSVVVEADDRRQAERFLSRLAAAQPTEPAPCAVVLRYAMTAKELRTATGRVTHSAALGNAALERLTGGRPALYESVLDAGRWLPAGELASIIDRSRGAGDLTTRLAERLLQDLPTRITTALGLAALLGYGHRRFGLLEPVLDRCGDLPWWTELTDGWRRFEPAWREGVLTVCRADRRCEVTLLGRLLWELVEDEAAAAAVELCLDADYVGTASDLLGGLGPDLISAGRPLAVRRWLRRLPPSFRRQHRALTAQLRSVRRADTAALSARSRRSERRQKGPGAPPANLVRVPDLPRAAGGPPHRVGVSQLALQARLLGPVDVSLGGRRVEHWHSRKGMLLLAYLLLQHGGRPLTRDALAVILWPDATPDASRNRLHVTLHTLRADLQAASSLVPVVVFEEHGYTFNPDLDVWLDTEEFERAAVRGNRAEKEHDGETALAAYRDAILEYRGDLLSGYPYDDWTLLPRERYRVRMLDVLGRAAQLAFDTGRYAESVESGRQLLALDFCREDAHRLLMRAYVRLGRPHHAVHQFKICSRELRRELDMPPAQETVELYSRIRARSAV